MIKWVIIVVLLIFANVGVRPLISDAHQVLVTDELAVSQLEDSDQSYIAMKANSRLQPHIGTLFTAGSVLLVGLALYSDRKKIKSLFDEL